ncbi:MAG TPA: ferrochelatase, partial [Acetobacteraceae bacterium]|nr:ferrochelatase [Acetobacteraceae bacterium]
LGLPGYFRAPTQSSDAAFIASVAAVVRRARNSERELCSFAGARQCPRPHGDCPHANTAAAAAPPRRREAA